MSIDVGYTTYPIILKFRQTSIIIVKASFRDILNLIIRKRASTKIKRLAIGWTDCVSCVDKLHEKNGA